MARMDKDEALLKIRKMLDTISEKPLTMLKKDIANLGVPALTQFHDFLEEEVLDD